MVFWTRVRLPSTPLQHEVTNPVKGSPLFYVFRNVCMHILQVNWELMNNNVDVGENKVSFGNIRRWILDTHGVKVSNGSINQVMKKCGQERLTMYYKNDELVGVKQGFLVTEGDSFDNPYDADRIVIFWYQEVDL